MRLFVAIDIPEEIKSYFRILQDKLPDAKMRKTSDFHLTLKFLGSVQPDKKEQIENILRKLNFKPFTAKLEKIGIFGSKNFPRVIWVSMRVPEWLFEMQRHLEELLAPLGFEEENRFSPHITLSRVKFVKDPDKFNEEIAKIKVEEKSFPVNSFHLFESKLGREGAVYNKLSEFP